MKPEIKLYKILLLLSVLFFSTSFRNAHPIKLTSSLIEYHPKTTSLRIECRVFIDDFTYSINNTFTKNINLSNLTKEDKKGIEDYFEKYYSITINDQKFPLKYKDSKVLEEHNVFILKFSQDVLPIKKGDQFCIENTLFFEEFTFMQTNMITVRIPPFITENYFEATFNDHSLPIDL
ncbi:hypothetical protein ATE84_0027 [Aquimarina sp. MAR_2010_214]|uniref:DUF6702 family protein n=1 Tax=Aquimarina sp. MAR_2010_214 TaxID=1250026 RepID=UPI000C70962B|nr:DUF6702 family protein [Aquimarina sp. MAR_2010_214]PKV48044.1 hypothetical protein ATE84_0027 [Aquimarina sp. MAR_2010_214]